MDECNKHGGVLHIYVDKASPQGNVYVKCPSTTVAVQAVTALHGRWFAGRIITAAYVPLVNYHSLFPDSITATTPLRKWFTEFWPFVCTVHFYVPRCPCVCFTIGALKRRTFSLGFIYVYVHFFFSSIKWHFSSAYFSIIFLNCLGG